MPLIQIKIPPQISSSRNPIAWRFYAVNTNWRNVPGYKVTCTLYRETYYRSGVYSELIVLQTRPNDDDFIEFDISDILASLVPEAQKPSSSSARVVTDTNQRYKVVFREIGIGAQLQPTFTDYHIIKAGRAEQKGQSIELYINSQLFLTNQPRSKPSTAFSPEYLSLGIPINQGADTAELKAQILYTDGTESSALSGRMIAFNPGDVLQFQVGYNQMGLQNLSPPVGESVIGYKVWIEEMTGGTPISEVMEYRFDKCPCTPFTRYYCFENTYGGIDTVITQGKAITKINIIGQDAERLPDPFRTTTSRDVIGYAIRHNMQTEQPIGHQTLEEQEWLMDLLTTATAWRIGDTHLPNPEADGAWIPISVIRANIETHQDNEFLNPLSFSFKEATYQHGT